VINNQKQHKGAQWIYLPAGAYCINQSINHKCCSALSTAWDR